MLRPDLWDTPLPTIVVTPGQWARRTAYRIDPLMGNRIRVEEPSRPCRIDGELDASPLWKERQRRLFPPPTSCAPATANAGNGWQGTQDPT